MTPISIPSTRTDRGIVLAAICLAVLVLPLDFSGAAVATPAIGRALSGSPVMLAWVVNAFMLTFGSTLLTAGALADACGRKRVFATGLAAFVMTSVAICLAPSLLVLDMVRAAQGLAAAAILAGGSAALAQEFEGPARTWAFSLLGTTFGTGLAFGPTVAGLLIDTCGWRSIFFVGALVGSLALVFGLPRLRETHDPAAGKPDWPGAVTFTTALAFLTAGLLQMSQGGWRYVPTIALIAGAAVLFCAFVAIERRSERPMLDLSLFCLPRFVGVQLLPVATCCSYVVLLVLLPARFIGIESYNEIDAGLLMLALSLPMLVVPFATALLTGLVSAAALSSLGLLVAAMGLVWLAQVAPGAPPLDIALPMAVIGFGSAMPWGLMDGLSVSVVPTERAGMATGIFSTVRVAGEGVALALVRAILMALLTGRFGRAGGDLPSLLAAGDLSRAALVPGVSRPALLQIYGDAFSGLLYILATIVVVASLASFVCLRATTRVATT